MRADNDTIELLSREQRAALLARHSAAMRVVRSSNLAEHERWDLLRMVIAPSLAVRDAQTALAETLVAGEPDDVGDDDGPYVVGDDDAAPRAAGASRELVTLEH